MKQLFAAISIVCFCSCAVAQNMGNKHEGLSVFITENLKQFSNNFTEPSKLLVINAFDAMSLKERKSKKELFRDLTDSVAKWIEEDLRSRGEIVIIPDKINYNENFDSLVVSLLTKNEAKLAIVITFLNAWFDLTHVEVERDFDKSKIKTAFFDICSDISYKLYNGQGLVKKSDSQMRRYFTSRSTAGSLLSFGPDVVGKRKYIIQIIHDNTMKLLAEL